MYELWKMVLSLSLSGTVVIVALFLFCRLFGKRFGKGWQYYIWLVAVFRLLVPFSVDINLIGQAILELEQNRAESIEAVYAFPDNITETEGVKTTYEKETGAIYQEVRWASDNKASAGFVNILADNLTMLWLVVAFFLLVYKVAAYHSFVRYICASSIPADVELLESFGKIVEEKKIKKTIGLYLNANISSPLLVGCFRPCIILPTREFLASDFYYVILHELTHERRMDALYKWLVQVALCLHWFNPFVWLMGREINRACELSCDEAVISRLDKEAKHAYGDTLLRAAKEGGSFHAGFGGMTMCESGRLLKRRLQAILVYQKRPGWIKVVSFVIAVTTFFGAVTLGAYARPKRTPAIVTSGGNDFLLSDKSEVIERDKVFYILCDGMTEEEVPIGGVVDGIMIVVVHRDYYSSVTLSSDKQELVEEAKDICRDMQDKNIMTEADAKRIIETARELHRQYLSEEDSEYINYYFIQSMYYRDSYLFSVGYDISKKDMENHTNKEIVLEDGEQLTLSFADAYKEWAENEEFLQILSELFSEFRQKTEKRVSRIERPLISQIEYVGDDIESLCKTYYEQDDMGYFSCVFPELPKEGQKEYLEKAFQEDKIAYFAIILDDMYEKGYLDNAMVNEYVERTYENDYIAYFSICIEYLSEEGRQEWKEKVPEERRMPYGKKLQELLEDSEEDWEEEDWDW
ncbi:MAG: hypothetical protein HFI12_02485 [Lachnospiraceae bacterium]|jgi:beta-lactamase regulating signal transducer with metallopeptidase domain|nr:hypothetical protein [Lachnospiraceae bacterium]